MARIVSNVPPGYNMLPELSGYAAHSGPYFWSKDADGGLSYGFQSDERHGNPNGVLHGGAIVTFVDTALGHTVLTATGRRCATVALDNQFVTAIPPARGSKRGCEFANSRRHSLSSMPRQHPRKHYC